VDLTVVTNVGDNFWAYGVYVCPDVDVATYTLAGIADESHGWGISGDTYSVLSQLSALGEETWFRLGDRDLAHCLVRTSMLQHGASLTEATERVRKKLGIRCRILPATDDPVETRILTQEGDLHLQEFWVRERGLPKVTGIRYKGGRKARVTKEVSDAVSRADRIVVCPANPITSIGPILAIPGFTKLLADSYAKVVAVSPIVGKAPFSGPAGEFLRARGSRVDSFGVAELYSKFLDCIFISEEDRELGPDIRSLGVDFTATDIQLDGPKAQLRLAKELLKV